MNSPEAQSTPGTGVAPLTPVSATPLDEAVAQSRLTPPSSTKQAGQVNKRLLLLHLQIRQVGLATVTYEGGGDEGDTQGACLLMADPQAPGAAAAAHAELLAKVPIWVIDRKRSYQKGRGLVFKLEKTDLEQALTETAWELATDLHGGFYNGDGGAGEVRFHPTAQTVVVAHNDYYTASRFSETAV